MSKRSNIQDLTRIITSPLPTHPAGSDPRDSGKALFPHPPRGLNGRQRGRQRQQRWCYFLGQGRRPQTLFGNPDEGLVPAATHPSLSASLAHPLRAGAHTCAHAHARAYILFLPLPVCLSDPGNHLESVPRAGMSTNCTIPAWVGPLWPLCILSSTSRLVSPSLSTPCPPQGPSL